MVDRPIRYLDMNTEDIGRNKKDKVLYSILSDCLVFCHAENYVGAIADAAG